MAGSEKKVLFKKDDQVVAKPEILKCPKLGGQVMNRSGLTQENLCEKMQVIEADGNQLKLKHPRLKQPFVIHHKFFEHATT